MPVAGAHATTAEPHPTLAIILARRTAVLRAVALTLLSLSMSGCATDTGRNALGYGDYAGYTCEQLGQEAVRLMRATTNRSEHILVDDQAQRDAAMRQLAVVKRASADKHC
jgi:hypothetical protein